MASLRAVIILFGIFVLPAVTRSQKDCRIPRGVVRADSPLILQNNTEVPATSFRSRTGDHLTFACRNNSKKVMVIENQYPIVASQILAACVRGSEFSIASKIHDFSSIECRKPPRVVQQDAGQCYSSTVRQIEIGFSLRRGFASLFDACYDTEKNVTAYTTHSIRKYIMRTETEDARRQFYAFQFATDPLRNAYTCENQVLSLTKILGGESIARRYINCQQGSDNYQYLVGGLLTPTADFLPGVNLDEWWYTYNTAPQWLSINIGNWLNLENTIRKFVNKTSTELSIITGTLGAATLPDFNGVEQKLYLDMPENKTVVPAVFWKLLHDRRRNAGIVFILENNPYRSSSRRSDYRVCACVCNKLKGWFQDWIRSDRDKGHIYCCAVENFIMKNKLTPLLSFAVRDLLHYS